MAGQIRRAAVFAWPAPPWNYGDVQHTEIIAAMVVDGALRSRQSSATVPWWSFGKTVLAAAALALVRDGKLTLDGPFEDKPYTLRQLLQHTAGVPNYGGLEEYHAAVKAGAAPWTVAELLRRVNADELLFTPDTGWAYSNVGYLFVRRGIEAMMGETIDRALQQLLFAPLGIEGVRLAETPADLAGSAWGNARGYHPGWVYHGLLLGSPDAAALFLDRLIAGEVLPDPLLRDMLTGYPVGGPFPQRPFRVPSYGLGVMMDGVDGPRRCVGHTGQGPGSTAAVYSFTEITPSCTIAAFAPVEAGDASQGMLEEHVVERAMRVRAG